MDLPIYKISTATRSGLTTDDMRACSLSDNIATDIEVLAGKVVKYLFTIRGSDVFDPSYGSHLMEYTQITKQDMSRLHMELLSGIRDCTAFIQKGEDANCLEERKLQSIQLIDLKYNSRGSRDRVDIFIKIVSKAGKEVLLDVPLKSKE